MTGCFLAAILTLTNLFGHAEIDTRGARVLSYRPAGGGELFVPLSTGAGGVPLCWPWFQYNGPKGKASPKHGIVRGREFAVVRQSSHEVALRLESDAATRRLWPHDWALTLVARLDAKGLTLELTDENTGNEVFAVTEAFHPYLRRDRIGTFADSGSGEFRTWNPNATSHLKTQGLGPDDWKDFICIENGTFSSEKAYRLAPGERHVLTRTFGVRQSSP